MIKIIKKKSSEVPKPLSFRQEKVVSLVAKGRISKASILRESGYAESVIRHPSRVFDGIAIKDAIAPILEQMKANRDSIVRALAQKDFTKESAFNLSMMMNMHTKDIELLSDRPIDRSTYELPEEEKQRIIDLAKLNKS